MIQTQRGEGSGIRIAVHGVSLVLRLPNPENEASKTSLGFHVTLISTANL